MCGHTRTRVLRERARARAFIMEGNGKVGRKEKESGGGVKRVARMKGRKESNGNMKVEQGVKNEGRANRKSLYAVQKGECGENKG